MRKVPDKPSHIPQAYQTTPCRLTVGHKNISIREILLRKPYFNTSKELYNKTTKNNIQLMCSLNKHLKKYITAIFC